MSLAVSKIVCHLQLLPGLARRGHGCSPVAELERPFVVVTPDARHALVLVRRNMVILIYEDLSGPSARKHPSNPSGTAANCQMLLVRLYALRTPRGPGPIVRK